MTEDHASADAPMIQDRLTLRLIRSARYLLPLCLLLAALAACRDDPALIHRRSSLFSVGTHSAQVSPDTVIATGARDPEPVGDQGGTRISDAVRTLRKDDEGYLPLVTQEYSTMSPFNADTSRLLLTHYSYFSLYDAEGNFIRDLPMDITASSQPRWSRSDPDIFYYIRANELRRFDISTGSDRRLHEFSEYETISGHGESDISFDGDHLVLAGDRREIFVYTISTDTKGPVLTLTPSQNFDNLQITPDNNVIVGWLEQGSARFNGYELFDRKMNFVRQLTTVLGHADVARDADGDEVLLWANGGDPAPPPDCENGLVKISLRSGRHTCLITFDWSLGQHVSAADRCGWFVISTYTGTVIPPPDPTPDWMNEILLVSLDGSRVHTVARHSSLPLNDYVYQPRASVSRDGTRIVYADNLGISGSQGYDIDYVDTYLLDISENHPGEFPCAPAPEPAAQSP